MRAARAELEAKGVAFRGDVIDSGVCHQTFFADPAGNTLGLHHRYAPPAGQRDRVLRRDASSSIASARWTWAML